MKHYIYRKEKNHNSILFNKYFKNYFIKELN